MDIPLSRILTNPNPEYCESPLSYDTITLIIIICAVLGLLWAGYNFIMVRRIDIDAEVEDDGEEGQQSDDLSGEKKRILVELSYKISDGCMQFVKLEYGLCLAVLVAVFLMVWFLTEKGLTTAVALLVGGVINMLSSLLALVIATQSNYRIAYCSRFGTGAAFSSIYKASCSIGFGVCSVSLLGLVILIDVVLEVNGLQEFNADSKYFRGVFESVAGYALGTSLVSIFTRVSGGVFSAASEVGAELAGKMEGGLPNNSPRSPAAVTQNVGENIGELLGGVAQFTSSLAETVCVVFILVCTSLSGHHSQMSICPYYISNFMYPLLAIAFGLFFCMAVSSIATNFIWIESLHQAQTIMRVQLMVATAVMLGSLYLSAYLTFPEQFVISNIYERYYDVLPVWVPYLCSAIGIVSALLLCLFNEFLTSPTLFPIQSLVESSRSSSAANLANGLALGYISTTVPIMIIAIAAYFSNMLLGFYGVGLAGVGVLSATPIFLAHYIIAPLADTSYQMAILCQLGAEANEKTEELDQVGKTSASRSRAFVVQPAALAGLALFGGYLFNTDLHRYISEDSISITEPLIFTGVLLGAMLPFLFSGLILPAVKDVGADLLDNVSQQYREDEGILQGNTEPDFAMTSGVVAMNSLKTSTVPILITLLFPLAIGFAFGIRVVAGYLIGLTVSATQFALAGISSGQAWKSTKKMIGSGSVIDQEGRAIGRESQCYKTSLIGEQVGNSLEKTSCIPLCVIIKLSGIVCVVFASEMVSVRG